MNIIINNNCEYIYHHNIIIYLHIKKLISTYITKNTMQFLIIILCIYTSTINS